jgi:acyl carrier protein
MSVRSEEEILQDLSGILRDFNGKEYSGAIGPKTHFFADLGMVSIDAVILAETLERFYNRSFSFNEFLSEVGRHGVRDIEIGELAAFLHQQMNVAAAGSEPCR